MLQGDLLTPPDEARKAKNLLRQQKKKIRGTVDSDDSDIDFNDWWDWNVPFDCTGEIRNHFFHSFESNVLISFFFSPFILSFNEQWKTHIIITEIAQLCDQIISDQFDWFLFRNNCI